MKLHYDVSDLERLERTIKKVGELPQKHVTAAARKGSTVVKRGVLGKVPVDTGAIKRGIKVTGERKRTRNKKVYQLVFDRKYNSIFQKPVANPSRGRRKIAYYPASQEYGFFTRSKGGGLSYVPGYHFMREGAEQTSVEAKRVIVKTVTDKMEKEWVKKNA